MFGGVTGVGFDEVMNGLFNERLKSGKVARAGLDVLTTEPCRDPPLFSNPKVTVQPHLGAFTKGTILRGEREVFANVKQYMETGVPVNPVNKPVKISP